LVKIIGISATPIERHDGTEDDDPGDLENVAGYPLVVRAGCGNICHEPFSTPRRALSAGLARFWALLTLTP
jgi:hypothetical protein